MGEKTENNIGIQTGNNRCWFCKSRRASENTSLTEPLYLINKRQTSMMGLVKTSYSKTSISVPRCELCKSRHSQTGKLGFFAGLSITSLVVIIAINSSPNTFSKDWGTFAWMSLMTGILMVPATAYVFQNVKLKDSESENFKEKYPAIKKLLSEGWTMGEKPPYKGSDVD